MALKDVKIDVDYVCIDFVVDIRIVLCDLVQNSNNKLPLRSPSPCWSKVLSKRTCLTETYSQPLKKHFLSVVDWLLSQSEFSVEIILVRSPRSPMS